MSSFFAGHGFHFIQSIHYIHHSSNQTPRLAPCPPCFAFTSWHPPLRLQTLARTWKLVHANPPNLARRGSKSLPPEMVSWRPAQRFCWTKRSALHGGKIVECSDTTSHTFHKFSRPMSAKHRLGIQSKQSLHLHRFSCSQVCVPQSFEMDHLTILDPQVLSMRFNETRS